jgi:hypothetical protein
MNFTATPAMNPAAARRLTGTQHLTESRVEDQLSESRVEGHLSESRVEGHLSESRVEGHLSESQINDHLIGDLAPAAASHLASCELCDSRVAQAKAPLAGFDSVTLAWSERRSATLPMQRFASLELSLYQRLAWGASMAAALTVGIAIPVANNQARQEADAAVYEIATAAVLTAPASQAQISNDNRMLQAIDNELNASADTPQTLGLEPVGDTPHHPASPSSSQAPSSQD